MTRLFGFLIAAQPPPRRAGVITALVLVALSTLLIYPLKHAAPVVSLGVVYLPAVLAVSLTWGAWLGVATALISAVAFNFFQLPPVGTFSLRDPENWVALVAFVVVASIASSVAEITRARARDAQERRNEADLAAEMARLLLRGGTLDEDLPTAAARLARALQLNSAAIRMEAVEGDERTIAFPLREGTRRLGTLLVGADTPEASLRRLQERVVPALESILSAALEREGLLGGGRNGLAAAGRRRKDGSASVGFSRPEIATNGHLHGGRGDRRPVAIPARARRAGGSDPGGGEAPVAAGGQPARSLAPGSGRRRAAPRLDLRGGVDPRRAERAPGPPGGVQQCATTST